MARISRDVLHRAFLVKWFVVMVIIPCTPQSPELPICDYFLCGFLKSQVYINKPRILQELKEKDSIGQEINAIPTYPKKCS